jgi:hypothetical protein
MKVDAAAPVESDQSEESRDGTVGEADADKKKKKRAGFRDRKVCTRAVKIYQNLSGHFFKL